jgi:excisionase family DNA binding protein
MSHGISTAEDLFAAMREMPPTERVRFFTLVSETAFEKDNFSHAEVFGDALVSELTVEEASEYLEVSVSTFRRYVQGKKIEPTRVVGRNQFFAASALKSFKKSLRAVKRH